LIAFIMFQTYPDTLVDFECIAYIATAIGLPTSIFFMASCNEPKISASTEACANKIKALISRLELADQKQT